MEADDYPQVQEQLDKLVLPALRPVDIGAIYQQALATPTPRPWRLRRVCLAVSAVSACLLLGVMIGRCDIALSQDGFSLTWRKAVPTKDPLEARLAQMERQFAERNSEEKLEELKGLLLTLAGDVNQRDYQQKQALARLTDAVNAFEVATKVQFRETEQTQKTLYNALFSNRNLKGVNP
jgi:hypothetical protein